VLPGSNNNLLWAGGTKYLEGHLMNANKMGGFGPVKDTCLQTIPITASAPVGQEPVAWDGGLNGRSIYVWPTGNDILQYHYDIVNNVVSQFSSFVLTSGGSLAVGSNQNNSGILWAVGNNAIVYGLNCKNISNGLWTSALKSARDALPTTPGHFQFPTVVNGKVYVGTSAQQLVVYGMLTTTEVAVQFLSQPIGAMSGNSNLFFGDVLANFQVAVVDINGNIVPSAWSITISYATSALIPPILTGNLTQPCINGVATFSGIFPGTSGTFNLLATVPTLTPGQSNSFAVIGVNPPNGQGSSNNQVNVPIVSITSPNINPMIAGIVGGAAGLLCLIAVLIGAIIFFKQRKRANEDKNYVYNPTINLTTPNELGGNGRVPTLPLSDIQNFRMETIREN